MKLKWQPDIILDSVCDITPEWMQKRGLSGLVLDLDNTLAHYRAHEAPQAIEVWLRSMLGNGFKLTICSNSREPRVKAFCDPLGLAYVHTARKPRVVNLLRAVTAMGLKTSQAAMVGDQIFTDVWSGRRAGMLTVLVEPVQNTFIFRLRRCFEMLFYTNSD